MRVFHYDNATVGIQADTATLEQVAAYRGVEVDTNGVPTVRLTVPFSVAGIRDLWTSLTAALGYTPKLEVSCYVGWAFRGHAVSGGTSALLVSAVLGTELYTDQFGGTWTRFPMTENNCGRLGERCHVSMFGRSDR